MIVRNITKHLPSVAVSHSRRWVFSYEQLLVFLQKPDIAICGAMQRIAPQESQRTPATYIAATKPELTVGILNSVF